MNGLCVKKIFNWTTTMSEIQWSVYKKMLQFDIPKAAKFWCNTMQ